MKLSGQQHCFGTDANLKHSEYNAFMQKVHLKDLDDTDLWYDFGEQFSTPQAFASSGQATYHFVGPLLEFCYEEALPFGLFQSSDYLTVKLLKNFGHIFPRQSAFSFFLNFLLYFLLLECPLTNNVVVQLGNITAVLGKGKRQIWQNDRICLFVSVNLFLQIKCLLCCLICFNSQTGGKKNFVLQTMFYASFCMQ